MAHRWLLRRINLLEGSDQPARRVDALIEADRLLDWQEHLEPPADATTEIIEAGDWWLAPPLVDPHSVLEDPLEGRAETLASLEAAAAAGGYGSVALLPWARSWRDRPERLQFGWREPMRLLHWGGFSLDGRDQELAPHAELLAAGAVGLAGGDSLPPLALLERGLRLNDMDDQPVLLAPREGALCGNGFVRERVEALRAGWPVDPVTSETLPLQTLLALRAALELPMLRLMNVSTAEGVDLLRRCPQPPPASVCWWHLIADSANLDPTESGWRLVPSLGGPGDREALISAVADGVITAVAVHHLPLDAEECLLPLDQRRAGLAGHGLVLPLLWQELVERRQWPAEQLWQALCWGPSRFLGRAPERLERGGRRWLVYDPARPQAEGSCPSLAANRPERGRSKAGQPIRGAVLACGFSDPPSRPGWTQPVPAPPSH
jgi:dihydroorotase